MRHRPRSYAVVLKPRIRAALEWNVSASLHVWSGEHAFVGRWRELDNVGMIAPVLGRPSPSASFVEHCCATLLDAGYHYVVTPALPEGELASFVRTGFEHREELHVLHRGLDDLPPNPVLGRQLRRSRRSDLEPALSIDRASFDEFWRFDEHSLREAQTATPHSRFRVAAVNEPSGSHGVSPLHRGSAPKGNVAEERGLAGYCITGRCRRQGFLQRLAVAPHLRGRGWGRALVFDALGWLERRRATSCVVNTQASNNAALELYLSCGFVQSPTGLHVMARSLIRP